MNVEESIALLKAREYTVSKSNELVQKSRYELSAHEQKTIAYICSLIKPRTEKDRLMQTPFMLEYEFNIIDYCRICGIDYDNGNNYIKIKAVLKGLRDKSIWLTLDDGSETTLSWLQKVTCNKRSGKVKIKLDEDMTPYLFDLQEKFVAYGLYSILAMKSQYSIRLYELLKSYSFQKTKVIKLDELKKLLMVDQVKSYANYKDFRKKVLEIATKEINHLTDLQISFDPILKGRKTVKVKFTINKKDTLTYRSSLANVEEALGDIS